MTDQTDPGAAIDLLPDQDPELNARVDAIKDRYMRLHATTDAAEWASAFMALFSDGLVRVDEGLMIGWFANAIMAGYDEARRRFEPEASPDGLAMWSCKIGEVDRSRLPYGCDGPMRRAVMAAYEAVTGAEPEFVFSGWGGALNVAERDVVNPATAEASS
jgi:hypothetical protein